jgi:ketosteroid isomerase-like protein
MRRRISRWSVIVTLSAAAALSACAATSDGATVFTAADSAGVRASTELWRTSSLSRDFDAWGRSVTADVVLYPPNLKPISGRDAAIAYMKTYPTITKFEVNVEETVGRSDAATDRGQFYLTARLPDGTIVNDTGSFLSLFRKQADGTWAHSRVMWNSNLPVPPAPPATPAKGRSGRD